MPVLVHRNIEVEVRVRISDLHGTLLTEVASVGREQDDGTVHGLDIAVSAALGDAAEELEGLVGMYGEIRKRKGDA